jgi:Tfp pilus assembly protein PilO
MNDLLKGKITSKDWMAVAAVLGITALIVVGFFIGVHQGQRNELALVSTTNDQVLQDLRKAQSINGSIAKLREETKKIEMLVNEFEERLPSRREIPTLFSQFEAMAADENILVEVNPLTRDLDERKETIPYSITARGNFHEVCSFINRLERFKRYLKITNIHLEPTEEGVSTANFTLNTYRFIKKQAETQS